MLRNEAIENLWAFGQETYGTDERWMHALRLTLGPETPTPLTRETLARVMSPAHYEDALGACLDILHARAAGDGED